MDRIRIARIITRLNVGGPAIQAMLLTERLDPRRFETLLIAGRAGPAEGDMLSLRPGLSRPPLSVPELQREIAPLSDVRAFAHIAAALRTFRPHVVHTHLSKAGLLGRLAAKAAGAPAIVHTYHGNVLDGYFDPLRARVFLGLERALARISTRVVAISRGQRREIERLGIARGERIVEIPLGFDLAPFTDPPRGLLRRELALDRSVPLVGIVARLVPIKRVDVFLDAAEEVARQRPDAHFLVVGDGEEAGRLRARAERIGIAAHTHFVGWRSDLPAVYGDLDVVVLTSDSEGTPVSILEALAARRPVVATAVGGVPDVLGANERGLLVPRRDPGALGEAIVTLLGSRGRGETLAAAGRSYVLAEHGADALIDRISGLYTGLVRRLA